MANDVKLLLIDDNPMVLGMLQQALAAEIQAVADYNVRLQQAECFGDIGLKVALENQVADETHHKEELERVLAGWDRAEPLLAAYAAEHEYGQWWQLTMSAVLCEV